MEASTATAVLIILSALVFGTTGQSYCSTDDDCMYNQYCYDVSHTCVNYTKCHTYNRLEGSKGARSANQCGDCLPKYSKVKIANGGEADSCIKVPKNEETDQTSALPTWVVILSCFLIFIFVCILSIVLGRRFCKSRKICCYKPEDVPEKPAMLMLESRIFDASAPPLPATLNNNNYDNADEESLPLSYRHTSPIGEHYEDSKKDRYKPVKAQPFTPPDWINSDPSYNPDDSQVLVITPGFPPATIDEETVPSVWRPTEQLSLPVPNRPFALTIENENSTNTALDNARTCPSSPDRDERRNQTPGGGRRTQGASTSNSDRHNDNGNRNRSEGSPPIVINNQININTAIYNKDSSGEGN